MVLLGGLAAGILGCVGLGYVIRWLTVTQLRLTVVNARAAPIEGVRVEFIDKSCGPHDLDPASEVVCRFHHRGATPDMNRVRVWVGATELNRGPDLYRGTSEIQRMTFEADGGVSFACKYHCELALEDDELVRWQARLAKARDAGPRD